jgi:hypothetical protein
VLVSINTAAARPLRIVAVEYLEAPEADETIELLKDVAVARFGRHVVARRHQMTGIEADTNASRAAQVPDHCREMLEAMAERPSLPSRVLEQHHRFAARPRFECHANRIRNEAQCLVIGSGGACTGMNDYAEQS